MVLCDAKCLLIWERQIVKKLLFVYKGKTYNSKVNCFCNPDGVFMKAYLTVSVDTPAGQVVMAHGSVHDPVCQLVVEPPALRQTQQLTRLTTYKHRNKGSRFFNKWISQCGVSYVTWLVGLLVVQAVSRLGSRSIGRLVGWSVGCIE